MRPPRPRGWSSRWNWSHTDAVARLSALTVLVGGAAWLVTRALQQDFAAYYTAGTAVARGLDPYVNHLADGGGAPPWDGVAVYRHSRFLYAPVFAHLFRPLAALPYVWAKAIFTALSVASLAGALKLIVPPPPAGVEVAAGREPAGGPAFMRSPWILGLCWSPVLVTLERGQIDLMLLLALAAAWRWRHRAPVAGGLLALVISAKPAVFAVLPVLAAARRARWAAATLAALLLLLGLNVVVAGPTVTGSYLTQVLPRASRFGEGGPAEWLLPDGAFAQVADELDAGWAHVDGSRRYAQEMGSFRRNASLPRLLAGDEEPSVVVVVLTAVVLLGAAAWAARRAPERPFGYWAALVATVVAAPVSWAMGLVWAIPVLALIPLGFRGPARTMPPAARRLCLLAFAAATAGPLVPAGWLVAALAIVAAAAVASTGGGTPDGVTPEPAPTAGEREDAEVEALT